MAEDILERVYQDDVDSAGQYEFNRKLVFEMIVMGHAQLAQQIGARGNLLLLSRSR